VAEQLVGAAVADQDVALARALEVLGPDQRVEFPARALRFLAGPTSPTRPWSIRAATPAPPSRAQEALSRSLAPARPPEIVSRSQIETERKRSEPAPPSSVSMPPLWVSASSPGPASRLS